MKTPLLVMPMVLIALLACGGKTVGQESLQTGWGGAGGSTGTIGDPNSVCPIEEDVLAPALSTDCEIAVRSIDPALNCTSANCPITKALDLNCSQGADGPRLSASADGAVVMFYTHTPNAHVSNRLMTVQATASRVQDIPTFENEAYAPATSARGGTWLFAGSTTGIVAVREIDSRWMSASVATAPEADGAYPTDASMVDDTMGCVAYLTPDNLPHLATWNGSCWSHESLATTPVSALVVATDTVKRSWIVWVDDAIFLRGPDGNTQNVFSFPNTASLSALARRPRLLPGGLDGSDAFPAIGVSFDDGIRIITHSQSTESGWLQRLLPGSAYGTTTGDCPTGGGYGNPHPCYGLTTCNEQLTGAGKGFGLARTASGATFVSWVVYSSESSYALDEHCDESSGEMGALCMCGRNETTGSGTADLVVGRLTAADPILTHFRFDLSSALWSLENDLEMEARGEILIVAGTLRPNLTYLEIDSTLLP